MPSHRAAIPAQPFQSRGARLTRLRFGACLLAFALISAANALADDLIPRPPVVKPARTQVNTSIYRSDLINVKFVDGLTVRLRDGVLVDEGTGSLRDATETLERFGAGRWERVHTLSESTLADMRQTAQTRLGRVVADLSLDYFLHLPKDADVSEAIDAFNKLDAVEIALPVARPTAAPLPGNYQGNQGYLNAPTAGIDTPCLWQLPGGTGANSAVADLEYSWNLSHQDFPGITLLGGTPTDPFNDDNHGTAVLGEMAALNNGWGVTGANYGSTFYVVAVNVNNVQNIPGAISTASANLVAGDVILIEQQIPGPNYTGVPQGTQFGLVPVEWSLPIYNAIVTAVGNGIVVVEAAGNGTQNLDASAYSTGNGGHWPFLPGNDSGAIIVGAGAVPGGSDVDRSRLSYSNYGSTVDLQGWGEAVYTTGYSDLHSSEGKNLWYTAIFSGTSSASPIVASACALLQSSYSAAMGGVLTPAQVRSALVSTGSPQQTGTYPASQNIGPRPDVAAALASVAPVLDANSNLNPDLCDPLTFMEACCTPGGGCADTTASNCTANGGTPQGAGTNCATTTCAATEACCSPLGACADLTPAVCQQSGGTPQGPGTNCATTQCVTTEACCLPGSPAMCMDQLPSACAAMGGLPQGPGTNCATTQCRVMVPKFDQPPTVDRDNIASNIDLMTMMPNVVLADDFQSDGRPITVVKWWGSYLDPRYVPASLGGSPSPFEIDGWLISFHEPIDGCPDVGQNRGLLGLYFAEAADVVITATPIPSCDGHPVYEYTVELVKCCLLHSYPDSRSGHLPAMPDLFGEEHCFRYDLDIQAVVGASWERDPQSGVCLPVATPNLGQGGDFWGWHSTDIENGIRPAQQSQVTMGPNGEWWYGPWVDAMPVCSPMPVNMAFQLLTDDPLVPPACMEACCMPDGACQDMFFNDCITAGGMPQGQGSNCLWTTCPMPQDCCLPDGSCQAMLAVNCFAQGGAPPPGGICLGDADTNGIDDACEAEPAPYVLEFSLDIGSDKEMSDPRMDGDEAVDPGDVYAWRSAPILPSGRDGFKDDFGIFMCDPHPDPALPVSMTAVPVATGLGTIADYALYFDLDGHDQLDVDLFGTQMIPEAAPLPMGIDEFPTACVHSVEHLLISHDDDMPDGWPAGDVPVTVPSMAGVSAYGMTLPSDEVLGISLLMIGGPPPLPIAGFYAFASETRVHGDLSLNPDPGDPEDDDVDSLDVVEAAEMCPFWYFTADHEAHLGLDPGAIYQVTPAGPVKVIDKMIHLGISPDTDIDAFEFAWLEDPDTPGVRRLALLYSVDFDDPLTPVDESGGMDVFAIHASFMTGISFPAVVGLFDDVDALATWRDSLQPCAGDCFIDGVVDAADVPPFVGCHGGPATGSGQMYCQCADFDVDGDVDLVDFAGFQRAFGNACP